MRQIILFISLFLSIDTYSENTYDNIQKTLTGFIVDKQIKSPEVYSFEKYGKYPVNLSIGIPEISIPIYTIEVGKLKYPISLSYHLSGIKVDEISSWVGLGWRLNAGGMITRTTLGIPDEGDFLKTDNHSTYQLKDYYGNIVNGKYPFSEDKYARIPGTNENYYNIKYYLDDLVNRRTDGQSDIYNYNTNSISGSFMYNLDRELIQVPLSNNKIIRNDNNTFEIISEDGTKYIYNDFEKRTLFMSNMVHISSWLISKIVSYDLIDTIKFTYNEPTEYQEFTRTTLLSDGYGVRHSSIDDMPLEYPSIFEPSSSDYQDIYGDYYTEERLLKCIEFRTGKIKFNLSERKDIRKYKLESIQVTDSKGQIISNITMNYGYFGQGIPDFKFYKRLELKNVNFITANNLDTKTFSFSYNNIDLPTYYDPTLFLKADMLRSYYGQDFWGYYNGVTTNVNLVGKVPENSILNGFDLVANRNPSETYMKASTLERIYYPTGGYTVFETEANKVGDKTFGGLRIKKIISRLSDNTDVRVQTFTFENPYVLYEPNIDEYTSIIPQKLIYSFFNGFGFRVFNFLARNYYSSEPIAGITNYMGSSVYYRTVTEEESIGSTPNGKIVYTFDDIDNFRFMYINSYGLEPTNYNYFKPKEWKLGNIKKEEYYEENILQPVKTIDYKYDTYQQLYNNSENIPIGKSVHKKIDLLWSDFSISPGSWMQGTNFFIGVEDMEDGKSYYECNWTYTNTGVKKLKRMIDSKLDKNSNQYVSDTTDYVYGNANSSTNKNYLLTEKKHYGSKHNTSIENYTYPFDYTTQPYIDMVSKNIFTPIVSQSITSNIQSKTIQNNYINIGTKYLVDNVEIGLNGNLEKRLQYNNYDVNGNPLYLTKDNLTNIVYLWSYNYQYPIAEIKNATYDDVKKALVYNDAQMEAFGANPLPDVPTIRTKLDNYFKDKAVFITTYTYKPLVGLTSMTDPRGITTTYKYDSFNRLENAKDMNNNILQQYLYHYQGQ